MPCRLYSFTTHTQWSVLTELLSTRHVSSDIMNTQVRPILDAVRKQGDKALYEYTRRHDCPSFSGPFRVEAPAFAQAAAAVDKADIEHIRIAARNIREFHQAQKNNSWFVSKQDGSIFGQKIDAVDRAGLYVPGGQGGNTPLISTLLMTAIPAQVAGVENIALVTPPRKDGTVNPYILAAAYELGLDELYLLGSAWAIAALAFGTESITAVDVIAGPGNQWVTAAKNMVQGHVGIDMLAGPSEILIIADNTANPAWIAADMLSQAEHDPLASALCLTTEAGIAEQVRQELAIQLDGLARREIAAQALKDWGAVVVLPGLDDAVALANAIAPEHLELLCLEPWSLVPQLRHAGAIFVGPYSPEPLGDYAAGPNHVLPTAATARFASALSVDTFCKRTSVLAASPTFAANMSATVARLARLEGLEAHARSMECRTIHSK